jgi:uncharacterized protein with NRDE domain
MQGVYGTRSSAALTVRSSGKVSFYEHYLDDENVWKFPYSKEVEIEKRV